MLLVDFFTWWYGHGWKTALRDTQKNIAYVADAFSLAILLRTLFSPWRRIISYPGAGVSDHFRAAIDNTISRFVGFLVRIFVLFVAALMLLFLMLLGALELIVWPLIPFTAPALIIWGAL